MTRRPLEAVMNRTRKTKESKPFMAAALLALVALLASSCGGSSPTDPAGVDPSQNGTLTIMMVDAPSDEICELWVYIKDLRVKQDGQPPVILGNEDIGFVELLELQDGQAVRLGDFRLERTRYQFIEILLDEDQSYVIESAGDDPDHPICPGEQVPLQIPSEKFKVNGDPFDVTRNTTVTLDFDAQKSLKRKGSAANPRGWKLNPDVSIVEVNQ